MYRIWQFKIKAFGFLLSKGQQTYQLGILQKKCNALIRKELSVLEINESTDKIEFFIFIIIVFEEMKSDDIFK